MVDTLVLGTSANAWEFESLHAQTKRMVNIYHPFSLLTISFQDSCDGSSVVKMPNFRTIEAA